jgi:hypothetical protein
MWKAGDPERRKCCTSDALRERRRHQENAWLARERDRRCQLVRDQHHDARSVIISPDALRTPRVQMD